jgi:hypothetical protein
MYVLYFARLNDYFLAFYVPEYYQLELLACGWCWSELVHLVPHAHIRLTMSLSCADWVVYRHLHLLPTATVGLAALVWALGSGFSSPQSHTHTVRSNYHMYS